MKYYIQSKVTGDVVVDADSLKEAQDLACAYEDNHFDEAIILDEEGNLVDDWFDFVYEVVANSDSGCAKMDIEDATVTLTEWKNEGVEVPAGLTAEALQYIFNEAIVDLDRLYEECIHDDDAAEYEAECREAATYDGNPPFIPEAQEDPLMERFQRILDSAVEDRDYHGEKWYAMTNDVHFTDDECRRMYIRYQQAQGFLEGMTNAIFAAGYNIISAADSTKLTVKK